MKKMNLLLSIASVLVVGGVYATWQYSQGGVDSVSGSYGVGITTTTTANKGELAITSADSAVSFLVGNKGTYHPELRLENSDDVTFTFTPNLGADAEVASNGIAVSWTLSVVSDWMYDSDFDGEKDKALFVVDSSATTIAAPGQDSNGDIAYSISASDIMSKITLNVDADFVLDTKAKYDNFSSWLDDYKFVLTISEAL